MASNLLKVFRKIESDRQIAVAKARSKGFELNDNASFADIARCIEEVNPLNFDVSNTAWQRPSDWPDCEQILRDAPNRKGLRPGYIVLMKADKENTTFPKYSETAGNTVNTVGITDPSTLTTGTYEKGERTCASGYLLSDGTWYDATSNWWHTWDTSKDIQTESVGPVRYFIAYVNDVAQQGLCINAFEPLEIILGDIRLGNARNSIIIWDNNLGPRAAWDYAKNLMRFKALDICNGGNNWKLSNTGMSGNYFAEPNLKEFIAPNLTGYSTGSSRAYMFKSSGMTLETFLAPKYDDLYTYIPSTIKVLEASDLNLSYFGSAICTISKYTGSLFNISASNMMRIPYLTSYESNWNANANLIPKLINTIKLSGTALSTSYTIGKLPYLEHIDCVDDVTGDIIFSSDLVRLKEFTFLENSISSKLFDVSALDLTVDSLDQLINGLSDVTELTTEHVLRIGANINKLLDADIAVIESKGWVLE